VGAIEVLQLVLPSYL